MEPEGSSPCSQEPSTGPYPEQIDPSTQNYWGFGLRLSSGILESRKHNVSETGSVSVLRWEGRHLLFCVPYKKPSDCG
jgi:hypothetical protein